ncbi:MAG: tRNA (guanine(10)-N(2))-dimethyltransferase, partial [Promethearchaeota archaeon]
KLLNFAMEEIHMPVSYYNIHKLSQKLRLVNVPKIDEIIYSIKNKGYKASRTQFDFTSIKTNIDIKSLKSLLLEIQLNLEENK